MDMAPPPAARSPDGKHPVTALAGPYGHPIHPILVTIPIGAWIAAFVFDLASRIAKDATTFTTGAYWLVAFGLVGAALAAMFGLLDLFAIPTGTPAFRTALIHMTLNLSAVAVFAVGLALRHGHLDDADGTPIGLMALAGVGLLLLAAAGWLGGKLTYRYGVRVVHDTEQADGYVPRGHR